MAPRQAVPVHQTLTTEKGTAKKNEDKVVKRPARGCHKFGDGLLNVTLKGSEKEL